MHMCLKEKWIGYIHCEPWCKHAWCYDVTPEGSPSNCCQGQPAFSAERIQSFAETHREWQRGWELTVVKWNVCCILVTLTATQSLHPPSTIRVQALHAQHTDFVCRQQQKSDLFQYFWHMLYALYCPKHGKKIAWTSPDAATAHIRTLPSAAKPQKGHAGISSIQINGK